MAISRGVSRGRRADGAAPAARRRRCRRAAPDRQGGAPRGRARRVRAADAPGRASRPNSAAQALGHVGGVMAAQRLVADRADELAQAPLQTGALFRRVETLALGFPVEQHFRQRLGAARTSAIASAPPNARDRRGPGPRAAWRSAGSCRRRSAAAPCRWRGSGLAAGLVAVETEDRLARHGPQQRALVGGQGGAERRDGLGKPAWVIAITST